MDIKNIKPPKPLPKKPKPKNQLQPLSNDENILSMIKNDNWPKAVSSGVIVDLNSEEEKINRALSVVEGVITTNLQDVKFLDFGCGEGHTIRIAKDKKAAEAIGYDPNPKFASCDNVTSNFEDVKSKGPYDVILMYDVIDHCENPEEVIKKVAELCNHKTKIYLTAHPWCSRHGSHTYRNLNKAFAHLILTNNERDELKLIYEGKIGFPCWSNYFDYFRKAGLIIRSCNPRYQRVENYFLNNEIIKNRLMRHTQGNLALLIWKMRVSFYDFVLAKVEAPIPENMPYPIASFRHIVGDEMHFYHTLYSNNKIKLSGKNEWVGNWRMNGNELFLSWPNPENDEAWSDKCKLNIDLQSWRGENQDENQIVGFMV